MIVTTESKQFDPQLSSDKDAETIPNKNGVNTRTAHPAKIELINDLKKYFTELSNYSDIDAEESLIYGMDITMLTEKCKLKVGPIYTTDENSFIFLNPSSKKTNSLKIILLKITDISKGKLSGNFKRFNSEPKVKSMQENCCLTVHYDNNFKYYDFIFKSELQLNLFLKAILIFLEKTINEMNTFNTDLLTLKKIWKEYDPDHNKHLNVNQFSQFLCNINFQWKKKNNEQIFREIDSKNQGKITFKDFISFYELIVTGEEFREVFQKYSSDVEKKNITVRGLMDFMEKEQHTKLKTNEVIALMTKYSKKARKLVEKMKIRNGNEIGELPTTFVIANPSQQNSCKLLPQEDLRQNGIDVTPFNINNQINSFNPSQKILEMGGHDLDHVESMLNIYENHSFGRNYYTTDTNDEFLKRNNENAFSLSFREFVNMLIDHNSNSVYNQDYFPIHQNMNLPLYDYFIYSSHNTYLDGNQINSNSNIEMYYCSIKNGCRLLELDCWDGRNGVPDEPIITHWYFMVGEINFKEVLINIKQWAFKKSEFPVILSVENHCSPPAQIKMEMYFKEVLGKENIYMVDPENPPLNFPSPNDLKRKYIIKCKRKRIFGNFDNVNLNLNRNLSNNGSNKYFSESDKGMNAHNRDNNMMNFNSGNSFGKDLNNHEANINNFNYFPNVIENNGFKNQIDYISSSLSPNNKENINKIPEDSIGVSSNNNMNINNDKIKNIVNRIVPANEVIHEEEINTPSEENCDVNNVGEDTIYLNNPTERKDYSGIIKNELMTEQENDVMSVSYDEEEGFDNEKLNRLCVGLEYKTKEHVERSSIISRQNVFNLKDQHQENIINTIEIPKEIMCQSEIDAEQFLSKDLTNNKVEILKKLNLASLIENDPVLEEIACIKKKCTFGSMAISPKKNKGSLIHLTNTGSFKKQADTQCMDINNDKNLNEYPNINSTNNIPKEFNKDLINEDQKMIRELFPKIEEGKELKSKNFNLNYFNETEDLKLNLNQNINNLGITTLNSNIITAQKIKSKKKKKSSTSYDSIENAEKNEIHSIYSNTSNVLFKKLKAKYSIDEPNDENQIICGSSSNLINVEHKTSIINKIQEIKDKDQKNLKKPVIKTIEVLQKIVGMVGVKYKREDFEKTNYLPWECISISEPDFVKYMQNIELKLRIIKLCQGSFLKIYPDILRTNSSNHDPIMCWSAGVQIAALNLQKTDDDWVLINKIFFKINGGSKCGYILKPEILRNPFCDDTIRKLFWKPVCKIKFKVLSGFHLHMCFPKGAKISGILVEVSLRSPYSDKDSSKTEVKLCTDTISNNFLHPVWQSNSVQFEIYDPKLSFIIVKLYSKKKKILLARSVIPVKILNLGYRVLDLYDNICSKFESSFLIVKSNRILL